MRTAALQHVESKYLGYRNTKGLFKMLIRIKARCKRNGSNDYELVDILRAISRYHYESVISRRWLVTELEMDTYPGGGYGAEALSLLFPEEKCNRTTTQMVVSGERLMERSAVVHQFESGYFLRVVDAELPVRIDPNYRLCPGPPTFQATNVDMEIRCDEALPYELVCLDQQLIGFIQDVFAETELIS